MPINLASGYQSENLPSKKRRMPNSLTPRPPPGRSRDTIQPLMAETVIAFLVIRLKQQCYGARTSIVASR